jgi:hypothetical protein
MFMGASRGTSAGASVAISDVISPPEALTRRLIPGQARARRTRPPPISATHLPQARRSTNKPGRCSFGHEVFPASAHAQMAVHNDHQRQQASQNLARLSTMLKKLRSRGHHEMPQGLGGRSSRWVGAMGTDEETHRRSRVAVWWLSSYLASRGYPDDQTFPDFSGMSQRFQRMTSQKESRQWRQLTSPEMLTRLARSQRLSAARRSSLPLQRWRLEPRL